ncbi:MAG: hypothetical protein M1291_05205 [Thaumarchaeota archaeon]|jgi:hypothetical protein|nr:hypothetical protein [Nitrososphaerota archaeon]MDG6928408.1 hypothetical protein [Nitrososphaerota archaeon]MDG6932523.1 hypothetical protein [Nitrososphaerota archaeon]
MSAPELVDFDEEGADHWITLKLKDGVVVKVKTEVNSITRMGNDPNTGVPIYAVAATNVVRLASVPPGMINKQTLQKGGIYK